MWGNKWRDKAGAYSTLYAVILGADASNVNEIVLCEPCRGLKSVEIAQQIVSVAQDAEWSQCAQGAEEAEPCTAGDAAAALNVV